MSARIEATRRLVASRDAGRTRKEPAAYRDVAEFESDLILIRDYLCGSGAIQACYATLDPFIASVRAHGFHGFMMDVRDHSDVHSAAVADIMAKARARSSGRERLRAANTGQAPAPKSFASQLTEETQRAIATFRAVETIQDEAGEAAASTYIVSMTRSPETCFACCSSRVRRDS